MSLALYRKYRPQCFAEVIGQDYLVDILRNAAKQDRFSHAYLFYGPRGVGKTTIARLIAKAANCLSANHLEKKGEPCGQCAVCQEISDGRAMDVIEIDAASNRGIDEIRGLREVIRTVPSAYRRKVFIIDEVHMLTKEAFNALLKILEEPPEHALLILATTEYEKLPATIISRSQRYHLKKLSLREILKKIKMVAEREKIKITDEALELIAAAAEGGLRDAESLLDQVAAMTDNADLKAVEDIIGRTGLRRVMELSDLLIKRDLPACLRYLANLYEIGINTANLNKELITYLRRALAVKLDENLINLYQDDLSGEELERLKNQARQADVNLLLSLLKSLIRSYGEARYSPFPHVPLEVAIIENLK